MRMDLKRRQVTWSSVRLRLRLRLQRRLHAWLGSSSELLALLVGKGRVTLQIWIWRTTHASGWDRALLARWRGTFLVRITLWSLRLDA